jgi:hypothetical protein
MLAKTVELELTVDADIGHGPVAVLPAHFERKAQGLVSVSTLIDGVPLTLSDGFPVPFPTGCRDARETRGGKRYRPAAK